MKKVFSPFRVAGREKGIASGWKRQRRDAFS